MEFDRLLSFINCLWFTDVKHFTAQTAQFSSDTFADTVLIFQVYANNGISARGNALMGLSSDLLWKFLQERSLLSPQLPSCRYNRNVPL